MNKKTQTLLKGNFQSKKTRRKACYIVTRKPAVLFTQIAVSLEENNISQIHLPRPPRGRKE